MKEIISGNRDYQKFFSSSFYSEDDLFSLSSYVLRQETQDGMLLCNTITGALVLLAPEETEQLNRLPQKASDLNTELIQRRFVVSKNYRENQTVEQILSLMQKKRAAKNVISHYNILPTTHCNARCFYCYESGIEHVHMSEDTANQLVDFIVAHHGDSKVKLSWFGGEPLLGIKRIDQICKALTERDIVYESTMTSNGYLFDSELVRHAVDTWKLKSIQITLDGTEKVYNQTKAYAGVSDNPYRRVIRNIEYLVNADVSVDIRLNLDSHNDEDLETLIGQLSDRFQERKRLSVYVSRLEEGAGFNPIGHMQGDEEHLEQRFIALKELLESSGWPQYREKKLPSLRASSCMADDPCSIQCSPDGILSKCEDQIFNHTVGTIEKGIDNRNEIRWWQERRAFDECKRCPLYPCCQNLLKNCPVTLTKCSEYDRKRRIARYQEIMLQEYEKWKNKKN